MSAAQRKSIPTEDEFGEFYGQTLPIRLEFVAGPYPSLEEMWGGGDRIRVLLAQRDKRLHAHFDKLRSHAVYKYLLANPNMDSALRRFRVLAAEAGTVGYGRPHGEWRFIGEVALLVGVRIYHPNYMPKTATLRQVQDTRKCASKLLLLSGMGGNLSLPHWTDQDALRKLLAELVEVLSPQVITRTRKPRADEGLAERHVLDALIGSLIKEFGDAKPALVADAAAILGLEPVPSTIDRRIKVVRGKIRRQRPPVLPQLSPEIVT